MPNDVELIRITGPAWVDYEIPASAACGRHEEPIAAEPGDQAPDLLAQFHVVGEEFVPIGEHDHSSQLERIRTAKPDVVLITLIGADSVVFNRTFGEQGLGRRMLRLAGAMDESAKQKTPTDCARFIVGNSSFVGMTAVR